MVILVTNLMLITQLVIKEQWFKINFYGGIVILLSSVISHHNRNSWSMVLLANVIIACGLLLFLVK